VSYAESDVDNKAGREECASSPEKEKERNINKKLEDGWRGHEALIKGGLSQWRPGEDFIRIKTTGGKIEGIYLKNVINPEEEWDGAGWTGKHPYISIQREDGLCFHVYHYEALAARMIKKKRRIHKKPEG